MSLKIHVLEVSPNAILRGSPFQEEAEPYEWTNVIQEWDLGTVQAVSRPSHCPCNVWFCKHTTSKSYEIIEASTHISKESLGG